MLTVEQALLADIELPCRDRADIFFTEDADHIEVAQRLCGRCPAKRDCLAGALARRETCGVWGGKHFGSYGRPAKLYRR
jgi:WhiB family redox-sensing transcriptional regulator